MTTDERCTALSRLLVPILSQILDDYLLLPTISPSDSSFLSGLLTPLLSLEQLFPRGKITEFIPPWPRYKFLPQLLELDHPQILALWNSGRLRGFWDGFDLIDLVSKRFGAAGGE